MTSLADALLAAGESAKAEQFSRDALDLLLESLHEKHPAIANARSLLGASLGAQERYHEAVRKLLDAHPILESARTSRQRQTHHAAQRLVTLYNSWGNFEQAAEWQTLLQTLVEEDFDS